MAKENKRSPFTIWNNLATACISQIMSSQCPSTIASRDNHLCNEGKHLFIAGERCMRLSSFRQNLEASLVIQVTRSYNEQKMYMHFWHPQIRGFILKFCPRIVVSFESLYTDLSQSMFVFICYCTLTSGAGHGENQLVH